MSRKKSKVMDFHWNYTNEGVVERKGFGVALNRFFAQTVVDYANGENGAGQLTPLSGISHEHMMDNYSIKATKKNAKIKYNADYAPFQYTANDLQWHRHTPGTTSEWLDFAWLLYKPQITGKVGAERRWRSK